MSKLFSDETLAHYDIKGQKKGYNKGRRNGKPLAKTIEELRAQASNRLYNGAAESAGEFVGNTTKSILYDQVAKNKKNSKALRTYARAASIGTALKANGNAIASNAKWKLSDALNPYNKKKKKKNTNKNSITSNLKNKSTKIKNKVSSIFKSKFKKKK